MLSHEESVNEAPLVVSVQGFEMFCESHLDKSIDFFYILNKNFVVLQEESKDWEHVVHLQDAEMVRKKKQLLSRCTIVQQEEALTENGVQPYTQGAICSFVLLFPWPTE